MHFYRMTHDRPHDRPYGRKTFAHLLLVLVIWSDLCQYSAAQWAYRFVSCCLRHYVFIERYSMKI